MPAKLLEIIIVNWNTKIFLDNCINSLFKYCTNSSSLFSVTVVDNASNDKSCEMLTRKYKTVKIIRNNKNLGFAKANNIAIQQSSAQYILLLNSDTQVAADIVKKLLTHMERYRNTAISGCGLVLRDGTRQVGDAGYKPCLLTAFNFSFFLSKLMPKYCKGIFHNSVSNETFVTVAWVSGAALIARKDFIVKHGSLKEDFFMYAEDMEWGLRAGRYGWQVHYLPQVKVCHFLGASSSDTTSPSTLWLENLNAIVIKEIGLIKSVLFWILLGIGYFIRLILYTVLEWQKPCEIYKKKICLVKSALIAAFKISVKNTCLILGRG